MSLSASERHRIVDRVFDRLPTGATADLRLWEERFGTIRFAVGRIHQPHAESLRGASLRAVVGHGIATATTGDLSNAGLRALADTAVAFAQVAPEDPSFPGFPGASRAPAVPYSRRTAQMPLESQVRIAEEVLGGASEVHPDSRIAGVVHIGEERWTVANTSGRWAECRRSIANANLLVERLELDPPGSGWAERASWDASQLKPRLLGREAAERAPRVAPVAAPAGRRRVVLDGSAAAKLAIELAYLGYGSRGFEEGWSCLKGRVGRRTLAPCLSIADDATSPDSLPQAIDYEGTPKKRSTLAVRGVVHAPVTDLRSAARLHLRPTGHALPPEAPFGEFGALPTHLAVTSSSAGRFEELLREVGDGLLVTRFHYVRVVHAGRSMITGMTRDGTYRIRHGELAEPVVNLRFTESVVRALASAKMLGRERRCYAGEDERGGSCVTTGALALGGFRFTSATVF
jgi:PmbA protein